jgi:predicted O-linked N-acetylglucosamine transferase (SPINDLY family)
MWLEEERYINELNERIALNQKAIFPFQYLALSDSPSAQLAIAKSYNEKFDDIEVQPLGDGFKKHKKIKIAYVSADFKSHPMAYLMAEVFELHDRGRFEIYAFSLSSLNQSDAITSRLRKAFDQFYDVSQNTDEQIYELARKNELTIAVDLMGYTTNARTTIFAKRIAPIQINFLGYPGTMGANFMDYIIADKNVIPKEQRKFYAENIIFMPHTFQPNDNKKIISKQLTSKTEVSLPEDRFIFCCFNSIYKINKNIFSAWIEILKLAPNSILWLCTDNSVTIKNLRNSMVEGNLDPERLIFSKPQPYSQYLEMYKFADLFLDTIPFNAGTTARDALYCGVPVLTIEGQSFAGRMASSLLQAIDMNELIARDLTDYINAAIKLATNKEVYKAIKLNLSIKKGSRQFCPEDYARSLESAYEKIGKIALNNGEYSDLYI